MVQGSQGKIIEESGEEEDDEMEIRDDYDEERAYF